MEESEGFLAGRRDDMFESFGEAGWHQQPMLHLNAVSLQNSAQNLSRSFGAPPGTSSCGVRKSMVMKQIQKEQRRQQSSNSRSGMPLTAATHTPIEDTSYYFLPSSQQVMTADLRKPHHSFYATGERDERPVVSPVSARPGQLNMF